jgi:pilus assembly protein Flp/PilA
VVLLHYRRCNIAEPHNTVYKPGKEVIPMDAVSSAEKGQGLVEYALILVLVAIVVIVMLALFGSAIGNMYSTVMANI